MALPVYFKELIFRCYQLFVCKIFFLSDHFVLCMFYMVRRMKMLWTLTRVWAKMANKLVREIKELNVSLLLKKCVISKINTVVQTVSCHWIEQYIVLNYIRTYTNKVRFISSNYNKM